MFSFSIQIRKQNRAKDVVNVVMCIVYFMELLFYTVVTSPQQYNSIYSSFDSDIVS